MGKSNGGVGKWIVITLLILFLIGMSIFVARMIYLKSRPNYQTIQEQEAQIQELQAKLDLEKSTHFWDTARKVGLYVVIAVAVCFLIWLLVWYKLNKANKRLSLEEAKKKVAELMPSLGFPKPLFMRAYSSERVVGKKLYLIACHYHKTMVAFPEMWNHVKWIGVDPDDWDCGRIENMPQGQNLNEAIEFCLHEAERHGYHVQKEPDSSLADAILREKQRQDAKDDALSSLGLKQGGVEQ